MARRRKVLVIGSGGREHALAVRLLESASVEEVVVVPGNAGTARAPRGSSKVLRNRTGAPRDMAILEKPDLVVVGPEAPLCAGIVDDLSEQGLAVFGPTKNAARLEGSKAFMKDFAVRHGIRTARHVVVRAEGELEAALASFSAPPVVKADGLCAGKGVVVAASLDEARAAALEMLRGERFGEAGKTVVLEERIDGAEASVHAISDGERFVVFPSAQDHKRIFDGDRGPNTGGMGAYSPAPIVGPAMLERLSREVVQRVLDGMREEGAPFRGTLFAGLMITPAGEPCLLEFNVRFGDPETEVLMNVVEGDLGDTLDGAARGKLDPTSIRAGKEHALCVVMASAGYPESARKGDIISGLDRAEAMDGVRVYHAGTAQRGQEVVTDGGRVLGVTGRGASLAEARDRAYRAAETIDFPGRQFRRDIGARALA